MKGSSIHLRLMGAEIVRPGKLDSVMMDAFQQDIIPGILSTTGMTTE